jgi:hypothetical protein
LTYYVTHLLLELQNEADQVLYLFEVFGDLVILLEDAESFHFLFEIIEELKLLVDFDNLGVLLLPDVFRHVELVGDEAALVN